MNKINELFNKIITKEKIFNDIQEILESLEYKLKFDNKVLKISKTVSYALVYRSLIDDKCNLYLAPYRACVSIGGHKLNEIGEITAKFCFIYLYYDENLNIVSEDFSLSYI